MNSITRSAVCLLLFFLLFAEVRAAEVYDFNPGWMFLRQNQQIKPKPYREHRTIWANTKAATAQAIYPFVGLSFDDKDYSPVTLPHDWSVEGGFYPEEDGEQGYRQRGWGYYRKRFYVPESWKGKHVELQFGGIATYATFWVNETLFHHNFSGYNGITLDITPMLMYGKENLIAVEVNADIFEGWWYEGAGIYRDVKLIVSDPVHIATKSGIAVNASLGIDGWTVQGSVEMVNRSTAEASPILEIAVVDPDNKTLQAKRFSGVQIPSMGATNVPFQFKISNPALWSPDTPHLYQLRASVKNQTKVLEEKKVNFGFRSFKFDFSNGFSLNGKNIRLKGVCNHQDHAGVGVAVPASIEEFRIRKLKEMGANAYRCSHNPPSENILDLCDKYGLLVIDENRAFNAGPEWVGYIQDLVRRDQNHPSIIAWSIFNEEPLQGERRGQEIARVLASAVKAIDPTRPVMAAMNGGFFSKEGARNAVDIVGFNYQYGQIDRFHSTYPSIPILLSEGASAFETRGAYATDREKCISTSYDDDPAAWGSTHRKDWEAVLKRPFLAGTFVWTGFDYHGEPTPYNNKFPSNSTYFGCMDLCGFPKTAFYIRQAQWMDKPILYAAPHWNWAGKEGQDIDVFCATNVEEVSFLLNGKNLGSFKVDPYHMLTQKVPYEPGTLLLLGKKGGSEVVRFQVETTGKPVALKLVPDRSEAKADGFDAVPVTVCAVDANGRVVPDANLPVDFEITGPGRNIGVGNGDPVCILSEKANSRPLFNGYAQIIVQTNPGETGAIQIRAKNSDLKDDVCTISAVKANLMKSVPGILSGETPIRDWRLSPASSERPDPLIQVSDRDVNTLGPASVGSELRLKPSEWVFYRANFTPSKAVAQDGGALKFRGMRGKAVVYINGKQAAEKKNASAADLSVPLDKNSGKIEVNVLMQADASGAVSLAEIVLLAPASKESAPQK